MLFEGLGLLRNLLTSTDGFESFKDLFRWSTSEWILDVIWREILESDVEFSSAGDLLE